MGQKIYWGYPTNILLGEGCSEQVVSWCIKAGAHKPLLVSDPGVQKLPWFPGIWSNFLKNFPKAGLFTDLPTNPSLFDVHKGAQIFREGNYDLIIAIGGGSVIDSAKGIALAAGDERRLIEFEWSNSISTYETLADYPRIDIPKLIFIPTTSGTGSELSRETVLVDSGKNVKIVITHAELLAYVVLLDPTLTIALPPHLTAATGMDALVHHIEAFCSPLLHPMSTGIAVEGIGLIQKNLKTAFDDGTNLAARSAMLTASAMAAVAFQKGLGGVHALAHPLGAKYKQHHGLLNAVLLPYVLRANRIVIAEPMAHLARSLNLPGQGFDAIEAWVLELRKYLKIPHALSALGLDGTDAEWIGIKALADISSSETNARPLTAHDYAQIYRAAVFGRLDDVP